MSDAHQAHTLKRGLEHVAYALSGPPPGSTYHLALLDRQCRWQHELEVLENENGRTAAAADETTTDQSPEENHQVTGSPLWQQRPCGTGLESETKAIAEEQLAPRVLAVYEHVRGNGGVTVADITDLGWTEQLACEIARRLVDCGLVRPVRDDGVVHYGTVLVV